MKQFGCFRLDFVNECLWREEEQLALPPRPFMVLRYLVEHPGRLITHDELLDALWPETYVQPQVLRTYMLELRKLLGDDAAEPRYIQTLPKRGYSFLAEVRECVEADCGRSTKHARAAIGAGGKGIVGRDEELTRLRLQMARAEGGERQVAFVTGEVGIGKTALVDAFCHELGSDWNVARGQCVLGLGEKEEYYPVMEALGRLCVPGKGDAPAGIVARMAPSWLRALGRHNDTVAVTNAERLPGDLCAALEQIADDKPLLLVFEDLHWGDASTLQLIAALARRRAPARLMIVATCGAGDAEHPLRAMRQNLLLRQLATEVALAPLTQSAVRELLSLELGQEKLPQGLTGFVHQHSEGNPLFAIAIVEHLIARRFLMREEKDAAVRWQPAGPIEEIEAEVPDRVAQMIELEIESLSADEQRVLGAGSVMGIAFPAWAIAAALGEDQAAVEEACAGLARRVHFVGRGGQDELPDGTRSEFYVFVHGLYREVLYRRQAATRRAEWHKRIADRLTTVFRGREWAVAREVAMHREAAGEWAAAAGTLRHAARHAKSTGAADEADALLEEAHRLEVNPQNEAGPRLQIVSGKA
ncbi:MAG TPA: AAA family ATPase [Acidobacteriaceae bacterium]|nr:AAA family ATPase [Acidobacteriaceae bacterium]